MQLLEVDREMLEDVDRILEGKVVENLVRYELDEPRLNCFFLVGLNFKKQERTELVEFLKVNVEVFTWTFYECLGLTRTILA